MKWMLVFCAALNVLMWSLPSWAQAETLPLDEGVRAASEDKAAVQLPQRSPLWLAVEAQYRHRGAERSVDDRRLTEAQRQELRDQIRRGAGSVEGAATSRGAGARPAAR